MIFNIYHDSLKYSIKNSKTLFYSGLTLFSTFIIWIVYFLILIKYPNANINLKIASILIPSIITLIPIFLFLGYEYKILKISTHGIINGSDKVPEFNNLKEMLINGAKVFFVKFIYFAIPTSILIITNIYYLNHISGGIIGIIGTIIALILGIIFYFVSFLSIANMAAHDDFNKAFDYKEIKEVFEKIGTIRYVLFYIGLLIIEGILIFALFLTAMIAMGLIGTISSVFITLSVYSTQAVYWTGFIITNLIFAVIIALARLFKTRGIGLIYEPIE